MTTRMAVPAASASFTFHPASRSGSSLFPAGRSRSRLLRTEKASRCCAADDRSESWVHQKERCSTKFNQTNLKKSYVGRITPSRHKVPRLSSAEWAKIEKGVSRSGTREAVTVQVRLRPLHCHYPHRKKRQ